MMIYTDFIKQISDHQTSLVQAVSFPDSCAMKQIPEPFKILISDLIKILHRNHSKFCRNNEILGIFSMQSVSCAIMSRWPLRMNHIIDLNKPKSHACYSINFLPLLMNQEIKPETWRGAKTIVVDFTVGEVMDTEHYYAKLFRVTSKGKVLGLLNSNRLKYVWQLIREEQA